MSQGLNMWSMTLLISVCSVTYCTKVEYTPVVTIKGYKIKGVKEDGFAKFLGVPYGVFNKNNPFGPSKPHPGFHDDFEATESKICPQLKNKTVVGTLDCLTVDIYVPNISNPHNRLPVMVWIRGDYEPVRSDADDGSPNYLLKHGVIVVAINYRHDFYGFLCLDIPEVPGNQGLKDQVLALRWINKHIEAFHGNPKEITVFGAGLCGNFVNLHLFSEYEKLFQRAIIQSGSALAPDWAKRPFIQQSFLKIVSALRFNTSDVHEALNYVSSIDVNTLLQNISMMGIRTYLCIEKKFKGVENFITKHPSNIVSSKARTTPIIIGYNDNEAAVWFNMIQDQTTPVSPFASVLMFENLNNRLDAEHDVRHFYIGDEEITEKVKWAFTNFIADFFYGSPSQRMVDQLLQNNASNVYRYVFSYNGGRNLQKIQYKLNYTGATHSDELGYLLNYDHLLRGKTTSQDQLMIDRMTTIWTNFAKFGNPIPNKTELLPIEWNPVTETNQSYLDINLKLSVGDIPTPRRMAFWDLFYKHYDSNKKDCKKKKKSNKE